MSGMDGEYSWYRRYNGCEGYMLGGLGHVRGMCYEEYQD